MISLKTSYKYLVFIGLILCLVKCSVEKNTGTTRFYHGLTARYNIYFNGYQSYIEGVEKVNNANYDDYAEILKVFEYSNPSAPSLCTAEMQRAMQKASKLITLKSITAKPEVKDEAKTDEKEKEFMERKEYNEWVDDSYFLIGKSQFYLHNFSEATSIFDYCIANANDPAIKTESAIWLSKIYNETGKYTESFRVLSGLEMPQLSTKELKVVYYTTLADLFVKQKRYPEAIEPLANSLDYITGKKSKYRLTYLLAQLYEQNGDAPRSIELYKKVVKMNPPYDVEFNANINIAGVFDINSGNPQAIENELERMLRDSKNKDFLDQIYYALGKLALKEGKDEEALVFFRKSAAASVKNQNQKGRSYLAIADFYYTKTNFFKAGLYYDSAMTSIDRNYPDYLALQTKSQNLNLLVTQLNIIQNEDSLQNVARMPEEQRNAVISALINKVTMEESEGKKTDYAERSGKGQYYENARRAQNTIEQEGKWYFYNQTALTFGRTEFKRLWGNRKLEDNWRRANKTSVTVAQDELPSEEATAGKADSAKALQDNKSPQYYLSKLPLSDSLIEISNNKIASAYLDAGKIYEEKINDTGKASSSFESLTSRFPNNVLAPEALYHLYLINKENNPAKAESYRQLLLSKYPDSEFSRILTDPGYYEKKLSAIKMTEKQYQQAYNSYLLEDMNTAIALCNDALTKYSNDALAPKFLLLRAYSIARISDERTFKNELDSLIKLWPGTIESKRAQELIAFINEEKPELKAEEEIEKALEIYKKDTLSIHQFTVIIIDPAFNINQASFDVISYNIDNYTNKNYRTESTLVDNKYIMISVSGFTDYAQSFDYFNSFELNKVLRNPSGATILSFLINKSNLEALQKDKNPERYNLFFIENYLNKTKKQ